VVVGTTLATVLTVREREGVGAAARGSWLLAVVAVQSVALLGALLAPMRWHHALLFACLSAWLVGLSLYGLVISAIVTRLLRDRLTLEQLTPDYWITMGALAITALAGTRLLASAGGDGLAAQMRPLVAGLTVGAWAAGTAWVPWLVVTQGWRALRVAGACRYRPHWWAMVFPLAMYAEASRGLGAVLDLAALRSLAVPVSVLAAAAWVATAAGLVRRLADVLSARGRWARTVDV
jgi:tellurite resistance protein TehA-like permease